MSGLTANAPTDPIAALAARLATTEWSAFDAATRDATQRRLFDALGALVVGLATPEGALLRRYADIASGDGRALDPAQRCRLYVGATRATEIDDIDIGSCTTVGSIVVPVALVVASITPRYDSRALLAAIVAGYEATMSLGRAIGGATLLYRGVWPTYVTAAFGAAATTARVLGLDAQTTTHALALALARTTPLRGALVPAQRYYALGCAAAEGADAACAAAAGIQGDLGSWVGFAERCGAVLDGALVAEVGASWLIHHIDTKTWPTSRQALASVAAFRALGVSAEEIDAIERIDVHVPAAYRDMIDRSTQPTQRIESMVGVQYQFALATLAPQRLYDALRTSLPRDEAIARTMQKVRVHADEALGARFPDRWGGRVVLKYRSGEERAAEVLEPEGSAARPLNWDGLTEKYRRVLAASDIGHQGWLGVTRGRCERAGGHAGDVGFATELLAAIG
jgi:2-methylcitrate dehydratase PrpD